MATEKIAMGINLRKCKNSQIATAFGKYFPEVDVQKTLSLRGFAEHMASHGSHYSRSIVEGVLEQICDCLPELMAQGVPVKLGSLGTFYPTAEVKEGTSVATVEDMAGLNPNDIVKAIHIRFLPDATKLDNLCGPAFKEACSLEFRNIVDTKEVTIKGKKRKVQTLLPIATAVAEWQEAHEILAGGNTEGSTGSGSENSGNSGSSTPSTGSETITVTVPTISGTTPFDESTEVTMSASEGAEIRYTIDGSTPTNESSLYTAAITLTGTATVKAIAIKDGTASEVATKVFTKNTGGGGANGDDEN